MLTQVRKEIREVHDQFYDLVEKSDFSIITFLAFGAAFQLLSNIYLPPRVSALLPLLWLGWRFCKSIIDSRDVYKSSFTDMIHGKSTTKLPETSDGIVLFVLGARLNHPFGKLAPGTISLDILFKDIWREAEANREKWGYLGRTATLADTSDDIGTTTIWLSYWRDIESLQAFARSTAHKIAQTGWEQGKYPYVGIMHETYHAPKGHFETIYANFRRWGQGSIQPVNSKEGEQLTFVDTLTPNKKGSSMFSRMGWKTGR